MKEEVKELLMKYMKICLIVIVLEIILFNFNSYRTLLGNYPIKEFSRKDLEVISQEDGNVRILIKDIKSPVATIKLELNGAIGSYDYFYDYSDETIEGYMSLPSKTYILEEENTHYIPCYLSGNIQSLILNISEDVFIGDFIQKIVINEKIPFNFNFVRVILLVLICIIIERFKNSKILNNNYDISNFKQEAVLLVITCIFMLLIAFINIHANNYESLDLYNKQLIDALMNKQLSLLQEPTEDFKNLEDPYDVSSRDGNGILRDRDYIWDACYYNESFYVYFGILPALVIFLPYTLLTGKYLQCATVCLGFSIAILILLKEILCYFYKRYFKDVPFKIVIYSLIILYAGSLIFYMNGAARFYELAILSGVCCVLFGIFFIFKSMEESEKKYRYIFLGCLCMALSVACRPTNLLSSILIVPYLWREFFGGIKQFNEKKKPLIQCILAIVIPYVSVAIPLMWYNYVRFENILEFGANYQLTINNIKVLGNRIFTIPMGLLCNLFSIPNFIPDFPFVINHNKIATFYGFYFVENMIGGLFILAPICFLCFYIHKIHKKTENKELKIWIYMLAFTGILIATISAAKGGSIQRYLFDYAWMIILAGILIFVIIYQFLKTDEAKRILLKILSVLAIYILIVNISAGIVSEKSFFQSYSPEIFYKIKYSICFWE